MPTQTLTLNVSDSLYEQLKQRAEQTQRSVEEETLDVLVAGVSPQGGLPAELAEAVESNNRLQFVTNDAQLRGVTGITVEILP